MPTIQLQVTDDEMKEILDIANEVTGIKAVRYILSQHLPLLNSTYELEEQVRELHEIINVHEYYINDFHLSLKHFEKVSADYNSGDD